MHIKPQHSETYSVGAIIEHSWGYDQTNIDFFCIVKRSGVWITLVPMTATRQYDPKLFEQGVSLPGEIVADAKPFRRKLHMYNGEESGCRIESSYGWARLWDGKPSRFSSYA